MVWNADFDTVTLCMLVVFVFQLGVLSLYLPSRWRRARLKHYAAYPQEQFPDAYLVPLSEQLKRITIRRWADYLVVGLGVGLVVFAMKNNVEQAQFVRWLIYFSLLQLIPRALTGWWFHGEMKLAQQQLGQRQVRSASLVKRRLNDYVPGLAIVIAIMSYLGSLAFGIGLHYSSAWPHPVFGLIGLLLVHTAVIFYLAGVIYGLLYGSGRALKKVNEQQIAQKLKLAVGFVVFYSLFISVLFTMQLGQVMPGHYFILTSICLQLLFIVQNYSNDNPDKG